MKTGILTAASAAIALACAAPFALAQSSSEVDYDAIAKRVVNESAGVEKGDTVQINGSPSELDMLQALTAAVVAAGGEPIVTISLPQAYKEGVMQAPMENLSVKPEGQMALNKVTDVFINATAIEDPTVFAEVPEERINAVRESNQPMSEQFATLRARSVDVGQSGGIPTAAYSESVGADHAAMRTMFFKALAVSPETIAKRGKPVKQAMKPGTTVRVTSEAGTDLTFMLADKPSRVSTGVAADNDVGSGIAAAYLPAGDFYACIDPSSVNGTLANPYSRFRGTPVEGLRMSFENGSLTDMSASSGEDVISAYFDSLDDASKQVSLINIGLNPESQPLQGSTYRSWEMSGVTTVYMGNATWAGCGNPAEGSFASHLNGTTVKAGDTTVVADGSLSTGS